MAKLIKSLRVKRFKKFKDNDLAASTRNVLVGANNSGKTSLLHALRLFFFASSGKFSGTPGKVQFHKRYVRLDEILPVSDPLELWFNCVKGNSKTTGVVIEIEFKSGLAVEVLFTYRFGQVHVDASVPNNPNGLSGLQINDALDHKIAFIPGLVGILPQEPYVTPARRSAMSIEARYSEMYRSSLFHLNTNDKKALAQINKILSKHLNVEITEISFDPDSDVFVGVKYSQDGISLDLSNAGSGMLQVIQLLVYVYLHKPSLLLIDEPDAHLHPELQEKLGSILRTVNDELGAQLFVATHSPDVIDSFDSSEVYFVTASKKHLRPIKDDNAYVESLLENGIVTNSALSRIAVRPRCLVVEDKKVRILKKIDAVCRFGLFEIPGNLEKAEGVSKFQTIHQIYLAVQNILGKKIDLHFLQDSDGLPDRYLNYIQDKYNAQSLVVHILVRHEIENYLLDAKIIRAALKSNNCELSLADTREILVNGATEMKQAVRGDIRRKAKDVNRFCERPEGFTDVQVETNVDSWFDDLDLKESKILTVFPGKELKKVVYRLLQEEAGVDLRDSDLLAAVTKSRLAGDLKNVLKTVVEGRRT